MKDNVLGCLYALILGVLGVGIWCAEMFTDPKAADLWRCVNGQGRISENWAVAGSPVVSSICFIYLSSVLIEKHVPDWLIFGLAYLMMLLLPVMIIGLLPTKLPRWVYADWQYAKRHGLLDADGDIDQEVYENHADRKEF